MYIYIRGEIINCCWNKNRELFNNTTQISSYLSPWEGSEYVPVLAYDTRSKIVQWHRQASLHTFMLPFSVYEMSLYIQCPFALPWLCSLLSIALQLFFLCWHIIFYFPYLYIFVFISLQFDSPTCFVFVISISSPCLSLSFSCLISLLHSTTNNTAGQKFRDSVSYCYSVHNVC